MASNSVGSTSSGPTVPLDGWNQSSSHGHRDSSAAAANAQTRSSNPFLDDLSGIQKPSTHRSDSFSRRAINTQASTSDEINRAMPPKESRSDSPLGQLSGLRSHVAGAGDASAAVPATSQSSHRRPIITDAALRMIRRSVRPPGAHQVVSTRERESGALKKPGTSAYRMPPSSRPERPLFRQAFADAGLVPLRTPSLARHASSLTMPEVSVISTGEDAFKAAVQALSSRVATRGSFDADWAPILEELMGAGKEMFVCHQGGSVVGCMALTPTDSGFYDVAKMFSPGQTHELTTMLEAAATQLISRDSKTGFEIMFPTKTDEKLLPLLGFQEMPEGGIFRLTPSSSECWTNEEGVWKARPLENRISESADLVESPSTYTNISQPDIR